MNESEINFNSKRTPSDNNLNENEFFNYFADKSHTLSAENREIERFITLSTFSHTLYNITVCHSNL